MKPPETIYLDYAAATPVDPRVLTAMLPFFSEHFYNPSSPYAPAVQVRRQYEDAKARLAGTFGAKGDEIIMTAGATESINLALHATNGHVVTSSIEHAAVLEAVKQKDHTIVGVSEQGIVAVEDITKSVKATTSLVSIQLANNEIGTVQYMKQIASAIENIRQIRLEQGNDMPLYFHTDASQGFGQMDIHVARLGVDMMTLNSGKMYGPKQVGLLWAKASVPLKPLMYGGGQERGVRSGTENVAGAIGFAKAAELAASHVKSESVRLQALRNNIEHALVMAFPDAIISGHSKKRLPGILHISFPGLDAERILFLLEARGILVATGSACAANKGTGSHVLAAIGMDEPIAGGSLRISIGRQTTEESIEQAIAVIIETVNLEKSRVTTE